ncbi:MAG: class GN sortase [Pseudomonadota bacterium]
MRRYRSYLGVALTILGLSFTANGGYIHLKANLAQYLIERAWNKNAEGSKHQPWPWADTTPLARLIFRRQGVAMIILDGASGRNLAFGPTHYSGTPLPGTNGNTVITGHRDTHFGLLSAAQIGDLIEIETHQHKLSYRITEIGVVHESENHVLDDLGKNVLTLITCYPFNAIEPGTQWRYVVRATQNQHQV